MGLAEKRALAECQSHLEEWTSKIHAACGKDLEYKIDWDSLVKEGSADQYPAALPVNFFNPLATALKAVCADKIGKDAFASTIAKIKITSNRTFSSLQVDVNGDTLHLDADPTYAKNADDASSYSTDIISALEKRL